MNDKWEILHGDALKLLGGFAPGAFDAVITDPPYASGGRTQAEKNKSTAKKYSSMGDHAPPPFDGDAKDQRSWTRWAAEWLGDARKICKPGAPVCMFIDWRQLPAATDALQWAGWIWRGTAVWDKGNSRPQKGRFRQQAEYIVWGSNGDMPISRPVPCLPGVFKYGNPQNRIHLTEKPLPLMRDVVKITEPGGHILDPFAGSGTTVLAAVLEGYTATGIEVTGINKVNNENVVLGYGNGSESTYVVADDAKIFFIDDDGTITEGAVSNIRRSDEDVVTYVLEDGQISYLFVQQYFEDNDQSSSGGRQELTSITGVSYRAPDLTLTLNGTNAGQNYKVTLKMIVAGVTTELGTYTVTGATGATSTTAVLSVGTLASIAASGGIYMVSCGGQNATFTA